MKCSECHFENPGDTRFCGNCGTQIKPLGDISESHTKTVHTPIKEMERGTTIADRYEIIEELGRGGMGNVYRVVDKKINEEMALKLLHPVIAAEKKTIERFKNELKLARKITHKNVCRMYDFNEEEGTPYITMEYVPGEDLKNMIRMTGQMSVGKAVSFAKQICEGLAEAHRLGVVHRDLKSRNIMIDKEGNAHIMDFGIARSLKAEGITDDGIMVGTPEYMSPEQVKGEEADHRSDIYSFGIILFEMVTGKIPFEGDTSFSIAFKHKTEIPPDPREFNTQIPEELNTVILKCLEKEKEERHQSIGEMFSELDKIEKEISTDERAFPRKKTRVETPRKRMQRLWIAGILLSGAIIIVLGYLFLGQFLQKKEPRTGIISGIKWENSIAVLPFRDLSLERDQEYFCDAMTEAVITRLSSIKELRVVPYHTMSRYKDTEKSLKEIGAELKVDTILDPSLHKEGNIIRVNAQLTNVKDGSVIETYEQQKELKKFLEVQDDICRTIARDLEVQLIEERFEAVKKRDPANFRAYECYVKGKYFIERKYFDTEKKEDFDFGVEMYEKAIEIDTDYALAYWGLGNAYESRYYDEEEKNKKDLDLMKENYLKAYDIDPDLAEANLGLGWVYFNLADNDNAYLFFKRAFELDPDNSDINQDVGSFLRSIGLYSKAIEYYSRAIARDPLSISSYEHMAICSMYIGKFDEAIELIKKALEIEPDNFLLHLNHARLLIMMKKYDEAEKEVAEAEKLKPNNPRVRHHRAWVIAAKGEKEMALTLIKDRASFHYEATGIFSLLGMKDKAIDNIEKGINKGFEETGGYIYSYPYLINNPCYDNLRDDPRFIDILKREKKKYDEKLKKYGEL
ncbi:MAG: protein kinase [Candidatus Aminicenantes bacterium]|nr:protein kinase [Candidatus Aminicenantes bacterium]